MSIASMSIRGLLGSNGAGQAGIKLSPGNALPSLIMLGTVRRGSSIGVVRAFMSPFSVLAIVWLERMM
jgi:hypothetical protein